MGIRKKATKPRVVSGTSAFRSGRRVPAKDAEAYAQGQQPRTSPFAQAKRAAARARRTQ